MYQLRDPSILKNRVSTVETMYHIVSVSTYNSINYQQNHHVLKPNFEHPTLQGRGSTNQPFTTNIRPPSGSAVAD